MLTTLFLFLCPVISHFLVETPVFVQVTLTDLVKCLVLIPKGSSLYTLNKSFFYRSHNAWNSLLLELREMIELSTFKINLRNYPWECVIEEVRDVDWDTTLSDSSNDGITWKLKNDNTYLLYENKFFKVYPTLLGGKVLFFQPSIFLLFLINFFKQFFNIDSVILCVCFLCALLIFISHHLNFSIL